MTTASRPRIPPAHFALALAVVAIWGSNFVVAREGLVTFPPLTFAALRFVIAGACLAAFVPRPAIGRWPLIAYAMLACFGQFTLVFYAIDGHISPGLASLVLQTQVFFTVGLSVLLTGERLHRGAATALALCGAGVALIAVRSSGDASPLGIVLILCAAACWACGNIIVKQTTADMLGLVVWSSIIAAPALVMAAALLDGKPALSAIVHAGPGAWGAVLWQSLANAIFGYSAWNWLLAQHRAADVVPLAMLVPVFGMSASAWMLGEPMPVWKLLAALLVIAGLAVNLVTARHRRDPTT